LIVDLIYITELLDRVSGPPFKIMATIHCLQLKPTQTLIQCIRHRGGVASGSRKPRWKGRSQEGMFRMASITHFPPEEYELYWKIKFENYYRVSALSKKLFDCGIGAQRKYKRDDWKPNEPDESEKQEILAAWQKKLDENQAINDKIAQVRKVRIQKEQLEEEEAIQKELLGHQEQKRLQDEELTEFILSETKAIENRITLENLESAIEEAMNNPIDYEYAIDRNGYIYRGRETRSLLVPPEDREIIPQPNSESEKLLRLQQQEKENDDLSNRERI